MKSLYKIAAIAALAVASTACDDVFEPAPEPSKGIGTITDFPNYADAMLYNAYILMPYGSAVNSDVATDDAVTNDNGNDYLKIATGAWTSNNGTLSFWKNGRGAIQYINLLLTKIDDVPFSDTERISQLFCDRLKGEALGLRALFMYHLLRQHAGWVGGELLGVPNLLEPEDATSDFNQPRATFRDCMQQLLADADAAAELLPLDYVDVANENDIPAKYRAMGISTDEYTRVCGSNFNGRMSGRVVRAIAAQAALLAASPAFSAGSGTDWAEAAERAAAVIALNNGIAGINDKGHLWYTADQIAKLGSSPIGSELLWRGNIGESNDLEKDNFPPSLRGTGRVNPTQNLVDAFPMANGYPIADLANSGYDAQHPYQGRDPRLEAFIVVNGSTWGHTNAEIITGTYGSNNDALNAEQGHSTRTGYYMRKLMQANINLDPSASSTQNHVTPRIRYTEIYLDFAEAANEAWGPTDTRKGYSAYDIVKAIRARAGIGVDGADPYLESIKGNRDEMRRLIRNERRLELCFENNRFWDLRRWQADLNETARGMRITSNGGALRYEVIDVENRIYHDYMNYGPIPYSEVLKFSNLAQNDGWK